MPQNQVNVKVDAELFDHLCKKSQRNGWSNQEMIRHLIKKDFNEPSKGDVSLLTRYGKWTAKMTSEKIISDIQSSVQLALKKPLQTYSDSVKKFINTTDSSNKKMISTNHELSATMEQTSTMILKHNREFMSYEKVQFKNLHFIIGTNIIVQILLLLKGILF